MLQSTGSKGYTLVPSNSLDDLDDLTANSAVVMSGLRIAAARQALIVGSAYSLQLLMKCSEVLEGWTTDMTLLHTLDPSRSLLIPLLLYLV